MGLVFFAWVWGRKGARPWELVVHSGEWTTSSGEKAGKGPEAGERGRASGPLARVERPEKGRKLREEAELVDHWLGRKGREMAGNRGKRRSQWPTLKSGPLARVERAGKGWKQGKEAEPVAHSEEWTTSSGAKAGKGRKSGEVPEPVDHFGEWTTSWGEKA